MGNTLFMGGKLIVLGGDFRQLTPVVKRANKQQIIAACMKNSPLWKNVHELHLVKNERMRLENQDFIEWVQRVGDGTEKEYPEIGPNLIKLPKEICSTSTNVQQFIEEIYPDFINRYRDGKYLEKRMIVTPTNEYVREINAQLLAQLPGEEKV